MGGMEVPFCISGLYPNGDRNKKDPKNGQGERANENGNEHQQKSI